MTIKDRYKKERDRVRKVLSRMAKAGIEGIQKMPAIPKRVTEASIRRLQKITRKSAGKKAVYYDEGSGKYYKGTNAIDRFLRSKRARAAAAKKAAQREEGKGKQAKVYTQDDIDDVIIANFTQYIRQATDDMRSAGRPYYGGEYLLQAIPEKLRVKNKHEFAMRLESSYSEITEEAIAYEDKASKLLQGLLVGLPEIAADQGLNEAIAEMTEDVY